MTAFACNLKPTLFLYITAIPYIDSDEQERPEGDEIINNPDNSLRDDDEDDDDFHPSYLYWNSV